mgnify:CR=1 FL=1
MRKGTEIMKKLVTALVATVSICGSVVAFGETLYGYYTWANVMTGIEAWAWPESGYDGAGVRIVEGSYDSGWVYGWKGTHAKAEKLNNPIKTCQKYYRYINRD